VELLFPCLATHTPVSTFNNGPSSYLRTRGHEEPLNCVGEDLWLMMAGNCKHTQLNARTRACVFYRMVVKQVKALNGHSFISNLSDDRSTASSKTIPPLNAI
jgi:hypothetical protein